MGLGSPTSGDRATGEIEMGTMTKSVAVLVFSLFAGTALADATPAADSQTATAAVPAPATDNCPKGTVSDSDGECVKEKSGRMGFDLAAPSDDAAPSPPTTNNASTRGIKKHHHS